MKNNRKQKALALLLGLSSMAQLPGNASAHKEKQQVTESSVLDKGLTNNLGLVNNLSTPNPDLLTYLKLLGLVAIPALAGTALYKSKRASNVPSLIYNADKDAESANRFMRKDELKRKQERDLRIQKEQEELDARKKEINKLKKEITEMKRKFQYYGKGFKIHNERINEIINVSDYLFKRSVSFENFSKKFKKEFEDFVKMYETYCSTALARHSMTAKNQGEMKTKLNLFQTHLKALEDGISERINRCSNGFVDAKEVILKQFEEDREELASILKDLDNNLGTILKDRDEEINKLKNGQKGMLSAHMNNVASLRDLQENFEKFKLQTNNNNINVDEALFKRILKTEKSLLGSNNDFLGIINQAFLSSLYNESGCMSSIDDCLRLFFKDVKGVWRYLKLNGLGWDEKAESSSNLSFGRKGRPLELQSMDQAQNFFASIIQNENESFPIFLDFDEPEKVEGGSSFCLKEKKEKEEGLFLSVPKSCLYILARNEKIYDIDNNITGFFVFPTSIELDENGSYRGYFKYIFFSVNPGADICNTFFCNWDESVISYLYLLRDIRGDDHCGPQCSIGDIPQKTIAIPVHDSQKNTFDEIKKQFST